MDPWLTDSIKSLMFKPCMEVAEHIGQRLDNRLTMAQSIDERALTEDLVDALDTRSTLNAWGTGIRNLQDQGIYVNTTTQKSTREHQTGADVGITINRQIRRSDTSSIARYACLVQCKKVEHGGMVSHFFHQAGSSGQQQSQLMLRITPSSYYLIFTPPSLLETYCTTEPVAFVRPRSGCSLPVWNMGFFEYGQAHATAPFLSQSQWRRACGILVAPALAVDAQVDKSRTTDITDFLPNCIPFWYWFGELLIPGFVGDPSDLAVGAASNLRRTETEFGQDTNWPGVDFAIQISVTAG